MAVPLTIDYTSRDYDSIRADMLAYARTVLPEWSTRDPNDFGVVLVELFAGATDMLNYYIDRVASEAYLGTAVQRSSVLAIAAMLGYVPTPTRAAKVTLTLNNSLTTSVVVPAGTRFFALTRVDGSSYPVYFETDADVTIPAAGTSGDGIATVTATQGVTILNEQVGCSDGTIHQTFALFRPNVDRSSIYVEVDETGVWAPWRTVDHVLDFGPDDPVCEAYEDENGVTFIRFGDNSSGRIPTLGSFIRVSYRITDGSLGNVAAQTILNANDPIIGLSGVANATAATGGADRESDDHIRANVPRALRALNRAVTVKDYAALTLQVNGVAKAASAQTAPQTVTIYVAPTAPVVPGSVLKNAVTAYLSDKSMMGVTVIVSDPVFAAIDVTATVFVLAQYRQDYVRSQVIQAINAVLAYDQVEFGDTIVPADILQAIFSIDGVRTATVQLLDRTSFTGVGGVQLSQNEIPQLGTLSLAMSDGIR